MRDFAARASTSFAEGACCWCDLFRHTPQKDVVVLAKSAVIVVVVLYERDAYHHRCATSNERDPTWDPSVGEKGSHFLPPFFLPKRTKQQQQQ